MTNEEAKEKAIREAWEAEGFKWEQVSKYLNEHGDIVLPTPDLKGKIDGYAEAFRDRRLIGITLRDDGLWLQLQRLNGIVFNNGWTRIDGPDTLPKSEGNYIVLGKSGNTEKWPYFDKKHSEQFWLEYFTHWRPVVELPKPIY